MLMDFVWAFVVGGILCVLAQLLLSLTNLTAPRILVLFVVTGAILTLVGAYGPLVELAGAGATVPLSGFGYSLAKGALAGAAEQGWIGILTGGLAATSAGISAAIVFSCLAALLFNPKSKP